MMSEAELQTMALMVERITNLEEQIELLWYEIQELGERLVPVCKECGK
jgi:hypothetical protein